MPNAVPGTTGAQLVEWARRADARGFSSLGTIDRIVYDNYEPLIALAGAAAVTERIGLCTSVLLGPLRVNATELAKQALSLHALSAGRFTLGIGLGGRDDDYEASGLEPAGRGRQLDAMLERIREVWAGEEVGPSIARGYLSDYYAWLGKEIAEYLVGAVAKDPEIVKQLVAAYEAAGCDELIFCPSSADPDQVDLLAATVGL